MLSKLTRLLAARIASFKQSLIIIRSISPPVNALPSMSNSAKPTNLSLALRADAMDKTWLKNIENWNVLKCVEMSQFEISSAAKTVPTV